jgi:hypothetical protein
MIFYEVICPVCRRIFSVYEGTQEYTFYRKKHEWETYMP